MLIKVFLGALLGVISLAGLLLTVTVLTAVLKLAIFKRRSPIYLISAANMLCDTVQLVLAIAYLVPSIVFDSWLFEGGRDNPTVQFLGATLLFCWYYGSVAQMLMAINRVVVVCMPSVEIFSFKIVSIFIVMLCPTVTAVTFISQYATPCCQFSFDHHFLSYSYTTKGNTLNISNLYIDLPLNSSSSIICALCYIYIFHYVRRMDYFYKGSTNRSTSLIREYRYALQFCAISLFYLTAWVTFRVFPLLVGAERVEYYTVISISVSVNSSANAFVYIIFNQEVKAVLSFRNMSSTRGSSKSGRLALCSQMGHGAGKM